MDQARTIGLDRQLLVELISKAVLDERVRQLRLAVSDAEVARHITENPAFRGLSGRFDRQRFEQLIRANGYTESKFVAEQRMDLLRRQLTETVAGELTPPKSLAEAMRRYQNEQRSIEYVVLNRAKAGEIPAPAPEVLARYFEERKALFRAPEYRKLNVLALTPAEAAQWITVSDDQARAAYEARRARYASPERRRIQQIVFPNKADALAAAERLAGGLSFAALAAERGLKESDIDLGLLAKSALVDRAIAEAAFALKEGEVSPPVEGRFGTALVRVTKIEPEQVRTFEQVAGEIKHDIMLERATAEIQERHNKVEDERASGASVNDVAKKLGLTVRTIEAVDRAGRDPDGAPVRDLPAGAELLQAAFAADVGVDSDPLQLQGGGYVWYEVAGITRSQDRSLDDVRERVEARWRDDQIAERLKAKAAELVDKLKTGSLNDIAAAEGLKVETASELKRGRPPEAFSPSLVNAVFRTAKGATGSAENQSPTEWVVFRVTDVTMPTAGPTAEEAKRIDEAVRRSYVEDILGQYLVRLQNELGVTINQAGLRQVVGGEN